MSVLTSRIERRLEEAIGLPLTVEEDLGRLVLTGIVGSEGEHQAALDIVETLAEGRAVDDGIAVGDALPEEAGGRALDEAEVAGFAGSTAELEDPEGLESGDFTDQVALSYPDAAAGPTSALDDDLASEGDVAYVPPTDPVGTNREVIGGLQASSMDDVSVERSALDGGYGDEAIRDAILRELREDAATTDLELDVNVFEGVVTLRGRVPYLFDAEDAEEVAARVPGVVEVREELEVEGMEEGR